MTRRLAFALVVALAATTFTVDAAAEGRRRPARNRQVVVDGLIAAATADAIRVQTRSGLISVAIEPTTEIVRAGARETLTDSSIGQYTLTDAITRSDGTLAARRVLLFDIPASAAAEDTVRIDGKVVAVSPDAATLALATLRGTLTISVNATTIIRRDGVTITLADIAIGSFARVVGKPTGEKTLLALEIDIHSDPPPPPHDRIAGEVVEIRAAEQALVLRRRFGGEGAPEQLVIVRANEQTEIYRHRERIRLADIALGEFALAEGELDPAGVLVARRIDVADPPEPAPRIAGRVLEVSATERTFTVAVERGWMHDAPIASVTVVVNDGTKIYRGPEQVRFTEIKPGDFVHVAGEWNGEKALVASVIRIVTLPPGPPMPLLLGEITEIEPATRTLIVRVRAVRPLETSADGTVKVLVGDETKIFRNGQPSRFAELKVGEIVSIVGEVRDDGAILAKRIDVIVPPSREHHVAGDVVAVRERSIEIIVPTINPTFVEVRVTILVDEKTEIYRDGERVRLPAVQVGDVLAASGDWKDQSTFLAREIKAVSRPSTGLLWVRGTIEAIASGGVRLVDLDGKHWMVMVTRLTIIIRDGLPLRFEDLVVGDMLDVTGFSKGDHAVVAVSIKVVR